MSEHGQNERSGFQKFNDFMGIVGGFAAAAALNAMGNNPELLEQVNGSKLPDLPPGACGVLGWACLTATVIHAGMVSSRQR
jgi:hypothetical protein